MSNVTTEIPASTDAVLPAEVQGMTTEQPSAELQIASWLSAQAKRFGIHKLELNISDRAIGNAHMRVSARAPSKPDSFYADEAGYGATIEEAVAELRAKINPARIAADARKKAKELLAEAAKLEAQAQAFTPANQGA